MSRSQNPRHTGAGSGGCRSLSAGAGSTGQAGKCRGAGTADRCQRSATKAFLYQDLLPCHRNNGERQVDPGNLVSTDSKTALATVSTNDPVLVTFSISDADYLKLFAPTHGAGRREQTPQYQLLLADGSTYPHKGRFHAISRTLDQQTDTLTVMLTFPNPDHVLRLGQFAQVRAALEQQVNALLVPITAVHTLQGTQSVLLLDSSGHAVQRTISTASRQGDSYVVSGGLHAGDKVIIEGQNKVTPGDKVDGHAVEPQHTAPSEADAQGFES